MVNSNPPEEKKPIIVEFLKCKRCGKTFQKDRFFFHDLRERLCFLCEEGKEPEEGRDFYMLNDNDILERIKAIEKKQREMEAHVDVLAEALAKKRKKQPIVNAIIDECLVKSEDIEAKIKIKSFKRKRR